MQAEREGESKMTDRCYYFFIGSTECGSIACLATRTNFAKGQSKVALRTLQPGTNPAALAA
jgi:hypothetical protein